MNLTNLNFRQLWRTLSVSSKPLGESLTQNKNFPKQIFSGIQPTGNLHLGNYLGAIDNWRVLQDKNEAERLAQNNKNINKPFLCIVDLHALTVRQDPETLRTNIYNMVAALLSCGLDPLKSNIFLQSHIPAHTELQWLLGCVMPHNWLNRMTQFKVKSAQIQSDNSVSFGLYAYPLLQCADILLYKATHVPVGDDQSQGLELARDIASQFNSRYHSSLFPIPETIISSLPKVMSLRSGLNKMSKSDPLDKNRINLTDSNESIANKIKSAVTDSELGINPSTASIETKNLVQLYAILTGKAIENVYETKEFHNSKKVFKDALTQALIATIEPVRTEYERLTADRNYLNSVIKNGAHAANEVSTQTLKQVKNTMGLIDFQ